MGVTIATRFALVAALVLLFSACGQSQNDRLNTPGVVQNESPGPVPNPPNNGDIDDVRDEDKNPPPEPIHGELDQSYKTLRVRVFPILSVPSSDPYPKTADPDHVSLFNSGGLQVFSESDQRLIGSCRKLVIDSLQATIACDVIVEPIKKLTIHPIDPAITTTVKYDGGAVKVEYRGEFYLAKTRHSGAQPGKSVSSNSLWSVINYVRVDDYLLSVVPSEMPSNFGFEALKAQAVAARTYALFHAWNARTVNDSIWDVDPTTWYQSYRGALVEVPKTVSPAVVATSGLVMTYSHKLIEAFFSANSGGMVCSVSECFGESDRPYIVTKPDVPGIRQKPSGTWTTTADNVGIDARLRKLNASGDFSIAKQLPSYTGPQDIDSLEAYEVGAAGRVRRLTLVLKGGKKVVLDDIVSKNIRFQFGMKTAYYELGTPTNSNQKITGYGLGHGVGMSQWGARMLAEQGFSFDEILKFYYQHILIESL